MEILRYAIYRFGTMLLTLWVVSVLIFVIINLPPGDYLSNQIAELQASGQSAGVSAHLALADIRLTPVHEGRDGQADALLLLALLEELLHHPRGRARATNRSRFSS